MINLNKSQYFSEPYVHCIFQEIFSEDIYKNIVKNFPSTSDLIQMEDSDGKGKFKKYQISSRNHPQKFKKLMKKNQTLNELCKYLLSYDFSNYLLETLLKNNIAFGVPNRKKTYIRKIYDLIKKILPGFFLKPKEIINIVVEFSSIPINEGYLKPHSDGRNKLASIVIPIVDSEWKSEFCGGTNLLEPKDEKNVFNIINKTLEFNETNILKVVEFNKNQMLVFPKTYNSLHSVGPLKGDSKNYYRKSITMNIEKKIIF